MTTFQFDQCFDDNSIIEITPSAIELWHVAEGQLAQDAYLALTTTDWHSRLLDLLRENAGRFQSTQS